MVMVQRPLERFTFGCDPELFILNEKGELVSAAGLIPGTKHEPHKVKNGAVQVDGVAAEFNIDPASSFEEFHQNISSVMRQLKRFLPEGYSFSPLPAVTFSEEVWDSVPDEAKELGCEPDFNAWTGGVNPPPMDVLNPRMRTASGHLHIGWRDDGDISDLGHLTDCMDLVKQLDWYLGAWSIRLDSDPMRRQLYGRAGACRYKSYGVEYRVLSNFWLFSPDRRLAVWNRMQLAIKNMQKQFIPEVVTEEDNNALIHSINSTVLEGDFAKKFAYPVATTDSYRSKIITKLAA